MKDGLRKMFAAGFSYMFVKLVFTPAVKGMRIKNGKSFINNLVSDAPDGNASIINFDNLD